MSLKILIMANDFIGPQNACIGLAQRLLQRGHKVFFCITNDFVEKFIHYGFAKENLLSLCKSNNQPKETLRFFIEKILSYGFVSSLTPLEKVQQMSQVNLIKTAYLDPLKEFDIQLKRYLEIIDPDLIIYDGEIIPPVIMFWPKCPWIYLFCSNPIGLFDSNLLPPFLSDFPTDSNPESWKEFNMVLDQCFFTLIRNAQHKLCIELGYPEPPETSAKFFIHSPYLNLYQYPLELDYEDRIKIPDKCFRVDAFCREEIVKEINIPERFLNRPEGKKLIYFSLGSMGSCNLDLMQRLIKIFSSTNHLYLVSKGLLGDKLILPENMYGETYLPQISILKHLRIDLAIIHGGNNSLTETLYFGVPMIVMPLFYDQFLNGQRVQEKQIGIKMDPFRFQDHELIDNIDRLLCDVQLIERVRKISQRMQKSDSKTECCKQLENIAKEFKQKQ